MKRLAKSKRLGFLHGFPMRHRRRTDIAWAARCRGSQMSYQLVGPSPRMLKVAVFSLVMPNWSNSLS